LKSCFAILRLKPQTISTNAYVITSWKNMRTACTGLKVAGSKLFMSCNSSMLSLKQLKIDVDRKMLGSALNFSIPFSQ
jgi:hypothetical protein